MSTHNISFYEDLTKIIFELSSNTHLISSAGGHIYSNKKLAASKAYSIPPRNVQIKTL